MTRASWMTREEAEADARDACERITAAGFFAQIQLEFVYSTDRGGGGYWRATVHITPEAARQLATLTPGEFS